MAIQIVTQIDRNHTLFGRISGSSISLLRVRPHLNGVGKLSTPLSTFREFTLDSLKELMLGDYLKRRSPHWANTGASTKDTTLINFTRMLSAGPAVSLKGSPTVSPVTDAA